MRVETALAAAFAVALLGPALVGLAVTPAAGQQVPPPRLFVTLVATEEGGDFFFIGPDRTRPDTIIIPSLPVIVNVTVITEEGAPHTFTIRSEESSDPLVDLPLEAKGVVQTTEFLVFSLDRIVIGARNETAQTQGGRLKFVCLPHEALQMIGFITLAVAEGPAEPPEKGVFLRAYWIGLLGMAGTLLLIVISYFVIKGSSRQYTDHHEHIRRGGP